VILLDTNALLWLDAGHRRARPLLTTRAPLFISPATVLELQVLRETGRLARHKDATHSPADDDRWTLDDPPSARWFDSALHLNWTRDPIDRLLVAHALFRGWRLATADALILEHLRESEVLEL
jgi:PIN domain nuclease of toxin-antitoxin system